MFQRSLKVAIQGVFRRFGYRVVRSDNIPLADLGAFCAHIAARGFRPRHILDVGANKGEWSREVKRTFTDATFTLIEPQAEMRPFLDQFCAETPGARWLNAGAGACMGEAKLTLFPDTVSTTFAITEDQARQIGLPQRTVPLLTLDHVCTEIIRAVPELVKLDVEGFEYEVLKGSASLLGRTEVFLLELCFFEPRTNPKSFHEMVAIMADFGYRPYDFTMFMPRPRDGALGLCELAFARDHGLLRAYRGWN
jgi:FkbM family methyltransferase